MKVPIRILVSGVPDPSGVTTWGDVISNWEAYAIEWDAAAALVAAGEAPILDMFGDEGVTIKQVIKDLSDPAKLFTDYSRSFTVPASKKNNLIFKHYYNIDITNGLESRSLIPAKILMNNRTYKVGNLQVESVSMSKGKATHYKIKFIGKLSEIAKKIGEDTLTSLDFSTETISPFVGGGQFSNSTVRNLVFPLSSRRERYLFDSSTSSLGEPNAKNVAYSVATYSDDYGFNEYDIVGALKVSRILSAIESRYGFTIEGATDFDYIQDLYLWLHKPQGKEVNEPNSNPATGYTGNALTDVDYNTNSIVFTGANTNKNESYKLRFKAAWIGSAQVTAKMYIDGFVVSTVNLNNTWGNYFEINDSAGVVNILVESNVAVAVNITVDIATITNDKDFGNIVTANTYVTASSSSATGVAYLVSENIPNVKVTDFLTYLFKMFNIVATVDNDIITTKHYEAFMSEGELKDISEYVEIDSYEVSRPNLYSALNFQFEDGKTALENSYETVNGKKYGQLVYESISENGFRLAGSSYNLKVDSSRIPLEPLYNENGVHQNLAYCLFSDYKAAEQTTKCSFTYIASVSNGTQLAWNNGSTVVPYDDYILPTNVYSGNALPTSANSVIGLWFNEELDEYNPTSQLVGISLWNGFYKGITSQMFDSDKRKAKFKAYLPQSFLLNISLADTLRISNHYYNINSITTEYLSGVSDLELTLVGTSQLTYFTQRTLYVDNDSLTEDLHLTYLATSGEIVKHTITAGLANVGISMVGQFLSNSHEDYSLSTVNGGGSGGSGSGA